MVEDNFILLKKDVQKPLVEITIPSCAPIKLAGCLPEFESSSHYLSLCDLQSPHWSHITSSNLAADWVAGLKLQNMGIFSSDFSRSSIIHP